MAETRFDFTLDGEDAGSTPWEWDSISNSGSATFALDAAAANNESFGYTHTSDGSNLAFGRFAWTNVDKAIYWNRFYIFVPSASVMPSSFDVCKIGGMRDGGSTKGNFGIRSGASTAFTAWTFGYGFTANVTTTNFSLDAWHRIELKFVTDGSVGGVALYVDGDLAGEDLDQDTSGEFWDTLDLGDSGSVHMDSSGVVYFDDIVGSETQPGVYSDDEVGGGIVVLRRRRQ